MRPLLYHTALVENNDVVCLFHSAQSMGDDQHRVILHMSINSFLNLPGREMDYGLRKKTSSLFIQNTPPKSDRKIFHLFARESFRAIKRQNRSNKNGAGFNKTPQVLVNNIAMFKTCLIKLGAVIVS